MTNARSPGPSGPAAEPHGAEKLGAGLVWSPTLFDAEPVAADGAFRAARRTELSDGAWIDHAPSWLHGAAAVFDDLAANVEWRSGNRLMYGRFVDDPRLTASGRDAIASCAIAGPVIESMAAMLSARYGRSLDQVGINLYRDGSDSVAWHGDRIARERYEAVIAIVSIGGRRPFRIKPAAGGPSRELRLGGGDLTVMGGTFQRTWRHSVPKQRSAPPRIAIMFREEY